MYVYISSFLFKVNLIGQIIIPTDTKLQIFNYNRNLYYNNYYQSNVKYEPPETFCIYFIT